MFCCYLHLKNRSFRASDIKIEGLCSFAAIVLFSYIYLWEYIFVGYCY